MGKSYSYVFLPEQVYDFDWESALSGFEIVGFRPFSSKEPKQLSFLAKDGIIVPCNGCESLQPRIIVRKRQTRKWMIEEVEPEEATRIRSLYLVFNPQTNDFGAYSFVTLKEDSDNEWIPAKVSEVTDAD